MPFQPPKTSRRAWLRYATAHAEQQPVVVTCRPPTPIERLAAAGFTRRVNPETGLIWFEHQDGRATDKRETLNAAIWVALEAVYGC